MPHKLKILQTYFDEIWTRGHLESLEKVLAPDARTRGIMGDVPFDAEELAELVTTVRARLGRISVTFPVVIEQDDWLSTLVEISSHCAHNGTPVRVFNQFMARFDQDRMVEIYSAADSMSLFEQLGLLPENAMAVMLGGTQLR